MALRAASIADLLDALEPHLSAAVGASAAAGLRARGAGLALDPFRLVGIEQPLAAAGAPADLLLALAPGSALRRGAGALEGALAPVPQLLDALARPGDALGMRIGDAWLEYDVGSGDAGRPSVFASPADRRDARALAALLEAPPAALSALERLVAVLTPPERVQQLGVMHGRPGRQLRCVLATADAGAPRAAAALGRLGWDGDGPALKRALDRWAPLASRCSLAVGWTADGAFERPVGIELHLPGRDDAAALLAALERARLAAPGTAERLVAWHGHDRPAVAAEPFAALLELTRSRLVPAVVRRVHHVKLTIAADGTTLAKAYLGAYLTAG